MSALQLQYEQRIAKLDSELKGALEAKESLEAAYRQLKRDPGKTQDVRILNIAVIFIMEIVILQDRIGNLEKELKSMKDKLLEETNLKSLRWQNEERRQVSERMHEQW